MYLSDWINKIKGIRENIQKFYQLFKNNRKVTQKHPVLRRIIMAKLSAKLFRILIWVSSSFDPAINCNGFLYLQVEVFLQFLTPLEEEKCLLLLLFCLLILLLILLSYAYALYSSQIPMTWNLLKIVLAKLCMSFCFFPGIRKEVCFLWARWSTNVLRPSVEEPILLVQTWQKNPEPSPSLSGFSFVFNQRNI